MDRIERILEIGVTVPRYHDITISLATLRAVVTKQLEAVTTVTGGVCRVQVAASSVRGAVYCLQYLFSVVCTEYRYQKTSIGTM